MDLKLKICGMRDEENIREVVATSPDFMGFIFYPPSPRFVGENFMIPHDFPSSIDRVGVFVDEGSESIISKIRKYNLTFVQLHGNETPDLCRILKKEGVKVIKVFSVNDDFDFKVTEPYQDVVDFFLFDTKGKYRGGNAQAFNWQILRKYNQKVPFFLSGGLSPDNVDDIRSLGEMNLYGLDVNSGVEIKPGMKSVEMIHALRNKINGIQNQRL